MSDLNVFLILGNDGVLMKPRQTVAGVDVGIYLRPHGLGDLRILNVFVIDDGVGRLKIVIYGRHFEIVVLMATGVGGTESFRYHVGINGRGVDAEKWGEEGRGRCQTKKWEHKY